MGAPVEDYGPQMMIKRNDHIIEWISGGSMEMLWLNKVICRRNDRSYFEVLDVLELPEISRSEVLIIGGANGDCELNNTLTGGLIVIAEKEPTAIVTNILKAWRANRSTGGIDGIPTSNIRCVATISK